MTRNVTTFASDQDGGAFVDWKVLTALIVGIGIAVGTMIYDGAETPTASVTGKLSDDSLPDQIFPGRTLD